MEQRVYRIRRSFLIPFAVAAVLVAILLALSVFLRGSHTERIVLGVILVFMLAALHEFRSRRVTVGEGGITIRKFRKDRELHWEHITHLGTVILRKRAYVLFTTHRGFHVLSNAYDDFPRLIAEMSDRLGTEKVEEEVRRLATEPVVNRSDVISAWIAAAVVAAVILLKIFENLP